MPQAKGGNEAGCSICPDFLRSQAGTSMRFLNEANAACSASVAMAAGLLEWDTTALDTPF